MSSSFKETKPSTIKHQQNQGSEWLKDYFGLHANTTQLHVPFTYKFCLTIHKIILVKGCFHRLHLPKQSICYLN